MSTPSRRRVPVALTALAALIVAISGCDRDAPTSAPQAAPPADSRVPVPDLNAKQGEPSAVRRDARPSIELRLNKSAQAPPVGGSAEGVQIAQRIAGAADINGAGAGPDANIDILWSHRGLGDRVLWHMRGTSPGADTYLAAVLPVWAIVGSGDFNGDGKQDIIWQNTSNGDRYLWLMNGVNVLASIYVATVHPDWDIAGAADFTGDGRPDFVWQHRFSGDRWIWQMDGTVFNGVQHFVASVHPDWDIAGLGDYTGDGRPDFVWQNRVTGDRYFWVMAGTAFTGQMTFFGNIHPSWEIVGAADFGGDGLTDLLWSNRISGDRALWHMFFTTYNGAFTYITTADPNWDIVATADYAGLPCSNTAVPALRNRFANSTSPIVVAGTLTRSDCSLPDNSYADRWQFTLPEAMDVYIEMSSAFDNYIALVDVTNGVLLEVDDDDGTGLNAAIRRQLNAGTYAVYANSLSPRATGNYSLTLATGCQLLVGTRTPRYGEGPFVHGGSLLPYDCRGGPYGETYYTDRYLLNVPFPADMLFTMTSGFSPWLDILTSSGTHMFQGSAIRAVLGAGDYIVSTQSFNSFVTGAYNLNVYGPCNLANAATFPSVGFTYSITTTLATSDCRFPDGSFADAHTFNVPAGGGNVSLELSSGAFDAFMILTTSTGAKVATNDDGLGGTNARIVGFLGAGSYILWANTYGAGWTGTYTLRIVR